MSPVFGRRLSSSARGLLDCLAQLQLIEPAVGFNQQNDHKQPYDDIMAILQSLWLTEPRDPGTKQVTPPTSSSGVDMSSGSAGSGREIQTQGEEETPAKEAESVEKAAEEEEEQRAETSTQQATVPQSLDSPKEKPSSSDKSSPNDSSKSPTDNEQETLEGSGTPPTVLRAPLTKRLSQDPDPVWVLHLLKKLEKQFMNHYTDAMAEFKVRWDLDDSLILNKMILELKDEVSRRIQSSVEREVKKIQSRAGNIGRSPRPPQANLSRESTMTEKRRRMLKVSQ